MNVFTAAKALNQQAAQRNWHHLCDPTLGFTEPIYETLLQMWRDKAGDRPMPNRNQFSPRDLKEYLRNIVIFERESENPSRYRWRVIGTGITEVLGHNTGKSFEETIPAEHRPRWIACFDLVLDGRQPMRFLGRVHISGREYLDAEHLYMPLADAEGHPSFVMCFCRYTPRRSEVGESWENQIASIPGGLI